MTRLDIYARTVASATHAGACLTGHDWDGATYTTEKATFSIDYGRFVQHRRCDRCGQRYTFDSQLVGVEVIVTVLHWTWRRNPRERIARNYRRMANDGAR